MLKRLKTIEFVERQFMNNAHRWYATFRPKT